MKAIPITGSQPIIDFIEREAKAQLIPLTHLNKRLGYSKGFMSAAYANRSISLHASINYLEALGYEMVIREKRSDR